MNTWLLSGLRAYPPIEKIQVGQVGRTWSLKQNEEQLPNPSEDLFNLIASILTERTTKNPAERSANQFPNLNKYKKRQHQSEHIQLLKTGCSDG